MKPTPPTENQIKFAQYLHEKEAHCFAQRTKAEVVERLIRTGALHADWRTPPGKKEGPTAFFGEGADCEVP